jgi:dihydroorotate dehydrogenase
MLLQALKQEHSVLAKQFNKHKPMLLKIAPDLNEDQLVAIAEVVTRLEIDGVIATNTTIDKSSLGTHALAQEAGGLSGTPLTERSRKIVNTLRTLLPREIELIGCGGLSSTSDAKEMILAGSKLLQVYTGFIYQGPSLIKELASGIK